MNENKWSSHAEWAILMITILGSVYFLDAKIERQGERTDRLYEMFIDLLKDQRR